MGQASLFSSKSNPGHVVAANDAPAMKLFLFKLGGGQYALTRDAAGRNIPAELQGGALAFVRGFNVLPGEVRVGFDAAAVAARIAEDGYVLIACPFHSD